MLGGFGLSLGITLTALSGLVLVPLGFLVVAAFGLSAEEFVATVTAPRALASFAVSLRCAALATCINAAAGTLLAWVLTRYEFRGRRVLDALVELPFALPTAVAGLALTALCVDSGWVGRLAAVAGVQLAYTQAGIVVALCFVGFPFVVRSVQPVLEKLDASCEEAATLMGASGPRQFFSLTLPEIWPALAGGAGLCFARCLGEYGSVIFIAGNMPYQTEIVPLLIMAKLQEFNYGQATALALVLMAGSFVVLLGASLVQTRAARVVRG